jgi:hypothetical protein
VTPPRLGARRQASLAAPPLTVHPLSIHRPDIRLRSLSFASVRFSAFLASRRGKSDDGERRRPCQQGLISPWSQVRIPPPPPDLACTSQKMRVPQAVSAGELRAVHPLRHPCSRAQATSFVRVGYRPLADRVARRPGVPRTWPVAPSFQSVRRLCLTAHGRVTTIRTFRHRARCRS